MTNRTDVFCKHLCGHRNDDHFSEEALQGLNFAVSLAINTLKQDDPLEIRHNLKKAAEVLQTIQDRFPIESSNLCVDEFVR